jgi:hypothetical protein
MFEDLKNLSLIFQGGGEYIIFFFSLEKITPGLLDMEVHVI